MTTERRMLPKSKNLMMVGLLKFALKGNVDGLDVLKISLTSCKVFEINQVLIAACP